jgi:NAD-dependent DNA ligase
LLVGANPGSKLAKAEALEVTVYNEKDLAVLLSDG